MSAERQYPPHGADKAVGVPELFVQITRRSNVANNHFGPAENPSQSLSEAENRFGEKHMKRKLRAVPGCRCQIAQNHYQKEGDLTLNSTQQDRRQEPRSTWQVKLLLYPMKFRQGAQHRRCRSLTSASTITPDCKRHEL